IEFLIHEMHRAAGHLDAIGERLLLRFQSREAWQQRRMNVEDLRRKLTHKPGREQTHVTSKTDEVDFVIEERSHYFAVMLLAWFPFRRDDERVESALAGDFQPGSLGAIRNHDRDASIGNSASRNTVGDGHKVGAASGEENAEVLHERQRS